MAFKRGQSVFLRLTELKNGRTRMDIVPAKTANQDLSLARQQKHALSRAPDARPCKQEQATIITFGTEAVFQPEQTALSPDSETEMLQIADKINRKYKTSKASKSTSLAMQTIALKSPTTNDFHSPAPAQSKPI
jgi:hypothetical protein